MSSKGPHPHFPVVPIQTVLSNPRSVFAEPALMQELGNAFNNANLVKIFIKRLIEISQIQKSKERSAQADVLFSENSAFLNEQIDYVLPLIHLHYLQRPIPYFQIHAQLSAMEMQVAVQKGLSHDQNDSQIKTMTNKLRDKYRESEEPLFNGLARVNAWHLMLSAPQCQPHRGEIIDYLCTDLCHGICSLTKRILEQKICSNNYYDLYCLMMEKIEWFDLYSEDYSAQKFQKLTEHTGDVSKSEAAWELTELLLSTYKNVIIFLMYFGHHDKAKVLSSRYLALLDKLNTSSTEDFKNNDLLQIKKEAEELTTLNDEVQMSPWREFLHNVDAFYKTTWCKPTPPVQNVVDDIFIKQCEGAIKILGEPASALTMKELNQFLSKLAFYKSLTPSQKTAKITSLMMRLCINTNVFLSKTPALAPCGSLRATLLALIKLMTDEISTDFKNLPKQVPPASAANLESVTTQLQALKLEPIAEPEDEKKAAENNDVEKAQQEKIDQEYAKREQEALQHSKQKQRKARKEAQHQLKAQKKQLVSAHETKLALLTKTLEQDNEALSKKLAQDNTAALAKLKLEQQAALDAMQSEHNKNVTQLKERQQKNLEMARAALEKEFSAKKTAAQKPQKDQYEKMQQQHRESLAALASKHEDEQAQQLNSQQEALEALRLDYEKQRKASVAAQQKALESLEQAKKSILEQQKAREKEQLAQAEHELQFIKQAHLSLIQKDKKALSGLKPIKTIEVNPLVSYILEDIAALDIECYAIGGFVRNRLLELPGAPFEDLDYILNCNVDALPAKIKRHFKLDFHDSRRLKLGNIDFWCEPWDNLQSALVKRDFTINTFIQDYHGNCYDPLGVKEDLTSPYLKLMGDMETRFSEDPSLIIRMVRIANQTGKSINPIEIPVLQKHAAKIKTLPFGKYLSNIVQLVSPVAGQNLYSIMQLGLLGEFFPMLPTQATTFDSYLAEFWFYKLEQYANQKTQIDGNHILSLFMLSPLLLKNPTPHNRKELLEICVNEFFDKFEGELSFEEKNKTLKCLESIILDKDKDQTGLLTEHSHFNAQYSHYAQAQPSAITRQFDRQRSQEQGRAPRQGYQPQKEVQRVIAKK